MVEKPHSVLLKEKRQATFMGLLNEDLVTESLESYLREDYKGNKSTLTGQMMLAAVRLSHEVFVPEIVSRKHIWGYSAREDEGYKDIVEGLNGREKARLTKIAEAVSSKVVRKLEELAREQHNGQFIVKGDPEITGRMGDMRRGTSAFRGREEENTRGLGYIQSRRDE